MRRWATRWTRASNSIVACGLMPPSTPIRCMAPPPVSPRFTAARRPRCLDKAARGDYNAFNVRRKDTRTMSQHATRFGSLEHYEKGGVEVINDDARNYVFSNVFEVASRAKPFE